MCQSCAPVPSPSENGNDAAEAFVGRLLQMLNDASQTFMVSIGHRTGLFDAMEGDGWVTSEALAEKTALNERYVREWLGAMATGQFVEIDVPEDVLAARKADAESGSATAEQIASRAGDRYRLPAAHAAILGRAGEGLAGMFQWIAVLGGVESKIVDVFKQGGGVPYEAFDRFHEVMAEESIGSVVAGLHEHILPLAPGMQDRLDGDAEGGIEVLDVGCGSGRAICELARRFPRSHFTGYDLCDPAIEAARRHADKLGLTNVRFETRDITGLGSTHEAADQYDLVTGFDIVHDQRDPEGVLQAIKHVLKPGGTFLMQDIRASSHVANNVDHPLCPFFYVISTMHCMTVSLAQNGKGLGTVWGEELAVKMLNDAGFEGVTVNTLPHDIQNNWYVMQKPQRELAEAAA